MSSLAAPIVVGMLPCAPYGTERFRSVGLAAGWEIRTIDRAKVTDALFVVCDIVALLLDSVDSEHLNWIMERKIGSHVPLIVISKEKDPLVIASVLGAGADEYVRHPFISEELVVRVESLVLRARGSTNSHSYTWISLDHHGRSISDGIRIVTLSRGEWSVLSALLDQCGQVVDAEELANLEVLSSRSPASIISAVRRLRKRLEKSSFDALSIETIHRRGYVIRLRPGTRISA